MLSFSRVNTITILVLVGLIIVDFYNAIPNYYYVLLAVIWILITIAGSFFIQWNYHFKSLNNNPNTDENIVAITFDDGPHPEFTPKVLQLLDDFNAKATFFCVGKHIEANPELFKTIIDKGHTVGHHTYSHNSKFGFFTTSRVKEELNRTHKLVKRLTSYNMRLYRPAFGVTNPRIKKAIRELKLISIGWNNRSLDTTYRSHQTVIKRITSNCHKGDIILLHDTSEKSIIVLEQLLLFLQQKKFTSVSIDTLFKIKPYA